MMTRRARTMVRAVCGLAVLTGLGAYVYFAIHRPHASQSRRQAEAHRLFPVGEKQLGRLEIGIGGDRTVVERTGSRDGNLPPWRIVEPVVAEVDEDELSALLTTLGNMTYAKKIPAGEIGDPAAYGLSPPRGRIVATTTDGRVFGLLVGGPSDFSPHLYVRPEAGEEIFLVDRDLEANLLKTTFELREKRLVEFNAARLEKLLVRRGETTIIELERSAGEWSLAGSPETPADQAKVTKLTSLISNLRAISFPDPERPIFAPGLDQPELRVELRLGAGDRRRFVIGRSRGPERRSRVYAQRTLPDGPPMEVRAYVLEHMGVEAADLRPDRRRRHTGELPAKTGQ